MIKKLKLFHLTGWGIAAEYVILGICGACFTLSFPGVDWNFLAWIGMIPLCLSVLYSNPFAAFCKAFVWSWFWNFTVFFWLREIVATLPIGMAFILAPFTAVWAGVSAWLRKNMEFSPEDRLKGVTHCNQLKPFSKAVTGILFLLGSAGFWCITEWIRSWICTGLPWNLLAAAQWRNILLIQICEFTGIYGISFCIILMNMAIAMTLPHLSGILNRKRYWPLFTALLVLATVLISGAFLLSGEMKKQTVPFRAGVVQCDLTQRRIPQAGQGEEALQICVELSENILKKERDMIPVSLDRSPAKQTPLSVIIWPETTVPVMYRGGSALSGAYRKEVGTLITEYGIPFLIGSLDYELNVKSPDGFDLTNSALYIKKPGGVIEDKFSKIHIVPFGEYVPFGDKYPFLNQLLGMGRNLRAGERFNPIEIGDGVKAGISICYESAFPFVSRGHARNGANLLLIISNDAWYPTSNEPEQHFANALFRTVENRLPLLRCGNSSHSLWIDSCGIVRQTMLSDINGRGRKSDVFTVRIPEQHTLTFYSRFGDVFIIFCGFLFFLAAVSAFFNWNIFRLSQGNIK